MKPRKSWDIEGKRNRLYGRRWSTARRAFLAAHPQCCMCAAAGKDALAEVVDHIIPHRGDESLFWQQSNWQPLCAWHHNSEKARQEISGYSDRIGADGWPIDPVHPVNSGVEVTSGRARPDDLLPIKVPVILVIGKPASGKTTWCIQHMQPGDVLIDFDHIDAELNGVARRRHRLIVPILRERNTRLRKAAQMTEGRVFLTLTGTRDDERQWWKRKLGNVTIVSIETDAAICIERIKADDCRKQVAEKHIEIVNRWADLFGNRTNTVDFVVSGVGVHEGLGIFSGHRRPNLGIDLVSPEMSQKQPKNDDFGPGFA